MTNDECKRITLERLALWGQACYERHDTPMFLVTVGHDHNTGRLAVETWKGGPSDRELAGMLLIAAREMCPELLTELVMDVMQGMELLAALDPRRPGQVN